MQKIKLILTLTMISVFSMSCQKFLEEVNPNKLATDNFWKTLDDCDAGLTSVYSAFKNPNVLAIEAESNRSDLTYPGYGRPNTSNEYYLQMFTNASQAANSKWEALYRGIFRANQVIKAVTDLSAGFKTAAETQRGNGILAQARFFRGMFYFYLHNSFNKGSVIIYDFVPQNESEFYQSVKPATEVQAFYLADLKFAHENLPGKWTIERDLGRVTAGAAASLLGQSYLYDKDYATAKTYFKDVIENPAYGYALVNDIGDNFTTRNELNSESILEIGYSLKYKGEISVWSEDQVSNTLSYALSPVGGWKTLYPSSWLIMAYKNDKLDKTDPRNFVSDPDGTQRLRKYSLRTSYSIALVDDPDLKYYGLTTAQATYFNNQETAYFRKYTNWDIVRNETDIVPNIRSGVNVRVIRLADVYLMQAECLIQEGAIQEAMALINKVRHRSALQLLGTNGSGEFPNAEHDNVTYTAQSLMDHLMYLERPLELSIEGNAVRTIDMRRWGITKQRFLELSQKRYYGEHFQYVKVDNTPDWRWESILNEGSKDGYKVIQDYAQAAGNYNQEAHAYWPLPSSEIISNPDLNGKK
ncbi:putative outer membrane protein [Pedobacter sp. BAL39]|uniref:RagB/SusD family nutrient uptake outer membrane protein n=1 Tax=Pedobacter sp. BAL39 TaxID=391596 RepID=UPI0001559B0D|nr:RagB/SusD family nutrient uptake outer membrane protein [Pedobacter sp. BAL39]EDM36268.1 putative outer membrane protein [Pedobacter sp. BAL39]